MFAETFVSVNRLKKDDLQMGLGTIVSTWILSLVQCFSIWYCLQLFKISTDWIMAAKIGFALWLILIMPSHSGKYIIIIVVHYLYDGRPFKSLLLTNGHHLVEFVGTAIAMALTVKYC